MTYPIQIRFAGPALTDHELWRICCSTTNRWTNALSGSRQNAGFCEKLGCFDEITVYGTESELDADLPGAKPAFFFAPTHMGKRDKEWGQGKFWEKAFTASIGVTQGTAATLDIKAQNGAVQAAASWHGLLDNKVPGSIGLIISI